ncbi:MAG: septum formation initiator family protein [Kiritimatiellae bacterium]|nr:septum formation initiator family protein [Kiritimatiellia bacterium]
MKTFRLVLALVLAGCAVAAAVTVFGPMLAKNSAQARERDRLRAENDRIEREVAELRRKQNEFETDPEYVELTARRENRVRPGETVFDFGDPVSGP